MKKLFVFFAAFALITTSTFAQVEICNDGIDNDGDGFVDCYDSDCANFVGCKGGYVGNNANCEAKPASFPQFSMALAWGSPNQVTDHLTRISIGDLDRDGFPEVITLNSVTDKLYILDGRNGSIKKTITPGYDVQREAVIANLNNDNCAEIFIYGIIGGKHNIISYDCNFNELWRTQIRGSVGTTSGDPVHYGLADFDGDGKVELYAKDMVLDAQTGTIIVASATDWRYVNGGPVAVDLMGTSDLELVIGCNIYQVNLGTRTAGSGSLTLLKNRTEYQTRSSPNVVNYHTTSVADYNQDGFIDVIATGSYKANDNSTAFFWDVHNNVLTVYNDYQAGNFTIAGCNGSTSDYYKTGWYLGMGRINIGDIDGDGKLNATFVSGKYLYALKDDFTLFWRKDVKEETSGYTGCTLFDFNGDGSSEVVYRDENYLYIINGIDGSTNTQQTCISRTNREYPIVADVNADGATELCVTCGFNDALAQANFCSNTYYENGQVRAFQSASQPWVPARKLWNQHGYFNVNVNDDLTIPKRQQNPDAIFSSGSCTTGPNRPLNSFLNQAPFLNSKGCPIYAAPDLAYIANSFKITPPTCPDQNFTVSFQFTNQGDVAVNASVPVTFYSGDPTLAGAVKLNTITIALSNFKPGDVYSATNVTITGPGTPFTLFGMINDAGTTVPTPIKLPNTNLLECNYNNSFSAAVNPLPFALTAEKLSDDIKCAGSGSPDNGAVDAYRLVGGTKTTAPYTFYWYATGLPISGAPAYTGAVYSGIPAGTYSVYAKSTAFQCDSDTASVVVNQVTSAVNIVIVLNKPYTNCKNPNGELQAVVNAGVNPTDFIFAWYEGNDIFTSPEIGVNAVASNLKNTTYTVLVTSKTSGCQSIASFAIPDNTTAIVVSTTANNVVCSSATSGSVSANVAGNTSNYTFQWYNGPNVKPVPDFTGATYSNIPQGSYTVVATDNVLQCSSSPPTTVSLISTPPVTVTATKTSDQTSCDQSSPNGSATASVGGVTAGYSFAWFSGQNTLAANQIATTFSVAGLQQGIYTVQATDNVSGCMDTDEVTINNNIVTPTLSATTVDEAHCVPLDGQVTASVSTGVPSDYTFSWYNGSAVKASPDYPTTTNILSSLAAGTYTVSAVNTLLKCQATAITVTVLDKTPTISILIDPAITIYPSDCSNPTGALGVTVSSPGNTLGYTLQWYLGNAPFSGAALSTQLIPTSPNQGLLTNLASGGYTVVATDSNSGCSASQFFPLPFVNGPILSYVSQTDVTTCVPGNNGNVTVNLKPTLVPPVFTEADYEIDVYSGSNVSGAPIQVISGVAAQSNYTSSVAMTPGAYTFVAVCIGPVGNSLVGCKTVPITATIKQNGVNPVITAASENANTNCTGTTPSGAITASIDGGASPSNYTISWFNGTGTGSPLSPPATTGGVNGETAQNLNGGSYTVQAVNTTATSTGCSSTATFTIFNNPPIVSLSSADLTVNPRTLCNAADGSAKVNSVSENGVSVGLANYTFQWFDATMTPLAGTTNTQVGLAAGTYFVQAKNTVNNCSTSSPIQFIIDDNTVGTISVALTDFVQPTRCLQPANTLGSLTATASGTSSSGYNYNWYLGTSASGPVQATTSTIGGITVVAPATEAVYTVQVTNNTNQCTAVDTYHLPLLVLPVMLDASASPLTNCTPLNGIIFATVVSGSANNYTYNWSIGNSVGATPDYTGKQVTGLGNGNFTAIAIDNADAFCQSLPQTVTVDDERIYTAPIAIQISPLTNCDVTRPNGVASASVNNGIAKDSIGYVFNWYIGTDTSVPPIYTGAEISGVTNTLYTVVATNTITNCPSTSTITITNGQVTVPPPTIVVLSDVNSCITNNGSLSASVDGDVKDYIFSWYIGSAVKATPDFVGEIYSSLPKGFYTVTAQSRITGCVSGPTTGEVKSTMAYPVFTVSTKPASCNQPTGGAEVLVSNNVSIETVVWSYGSPPLTGPVLDVLPAGTYTVTITTTFGCATTATFTIINDIRPYNGISRNNDGLNEKFYIDCIQNFPNNTVKIFNRAGTLVYQGHGYDNADIVFDGRSNRGVSPLGNNLPDGTYFYVIDRGDGEKELAGYLEIVK